MRAVIDRFEGEYVIIDIDGKIENIKRSDIPANAREGEVLFFRKGKWLIDREATNKLRKEIDDLAKDIWED